MAKKVEKEKPVDIPAKLKEMKVRGIEQTLPDTLRKVRVRTLNPSVLLRDEKLPDELTPLIIKMTYEEVRDPQLMQHLNKKRQTKEEALAYLEMLDYVVSKALADETKVEDLSLEEKRWIFRLVLGPADVLATFRYEQDPDVGDVDDSQDVPPVAE